jgi:hypothetical protein
MKRLGVAACVLGAVAGAAFAQSAPKPGLWEITMHKQVINGQDITARTQDMQQRMKAAQQQMATAMKSMTPEQRKQMEQSMAAMASQAGTGAQRVCLTAESLKSRGPGDVYSPPGSRCEPGPVSRSGNVETFTAKCAYKDGTSAEVKGKRTIVSDNELRTQVAVKSIGGARAGDMDLDSTVKWIGADCGAVKPIEQLAREAQQSGADDDETKPPPKQKR